MTDLAMDYLGLDALLSAEELAWRDKIRTFVHDRIRPDIREWYEQATFPAELAPEMGRLGLLGTCLSGYGCPGRSAVEYGLAALEVEAGDSGLRTFVSVQGSLAMTAIHRFGTEAQKQRWLPPMAAGEVIGCFGLTEPDAGSDPGAMRTTARADGDGWVLSGTKMWITNGSRAGVAVVWAKTEQGIRGFLVPAGTEGFRAIDVKDKLSLVASTTSELVLEDCRLGDDALLPGVSSLRGPLACLSEARYGIVWGAVGAARACLEAAIEYTATRVAFGAPIAARQIVQQELVEMHVAVNNGLLLATRIGRLKDEQRLRPELISYGKFNN